MFTPGQVLPSDADAVRRHDNAAAPAWPIWASCPLHPEWRRDGKNVSEQPKQAVAVQSLGLSAQM